MRLPLRRTALPGRLQRPAFRRRKFSGDSKRRCRHFIARLGNGRLHLIRQRLAGAYGLTGVAGLRRRLMCRVMRVFRMLLMRGGRCLMCRGVTRTGDRARKKEACEIENREL
jgi:hypothetical protein